MPIYARFPWLHTREGPDKLPFDIELVAHTLYARSPECLGTVDNSFNSCYRCSALVPKIITLAKNANEVSPHTRRNLLTPVQLLDVIKRLYEQINELKLQVSQVNV